MSRWLEKTGNTPAIELTKLTKGGYVSFVSTPVGGFEEKSKCSIQ
ncbi:hypothetical protein [Vreelandella indica]